MKIGKYTVEEYTEKAISFHGSLAPGVLLGGYMVDLALNNLPDGEFFDVICETGKCLPDAVQLLTLCTTGNGWMKVINVGRFALTFYEKKLGAGIRVYLDLKKLEKWNEIKNWFMKLKPKKEQDIELLIDQIKEAASGIFTIRKVKIDPRFLGKKNKGKISVCPACGEAYPSADGETCLGCRGKLPYIN